MMDYSELVRVLRCKRDDCEGCDLAFFDKDEGWMCRYAAKDDDAADAIEELQAEVDKREGLIDMALDDNADLEAEVDALKHDIGRYVGINAEMTTEIETLRAKVKKAAKRNAELHAELEKWVSAAEKAGEPKRGEWIKDEEKSRKHVEAIYTCSACHNFYAWGVTELYPYCPNCGAKMEAQDESISKFADGEWWKEAQK